MAGTNIKKAAQTQPQETSDIFEDNLAQLEKKVKTFRPTQQASPAYIDAINELAWELGWADKKRSEALAAKAMSLSKKLNYQPGLGAAIRTEAYQHMLSGNLLEGVRQSKLAIEILEKTESRHSLATAIDIVSFCYLYLGNLDLALDFSLKSEKIFKEIGFDRGAAWAKHTQGNIYEQMGDSTSALKEHEKSAAIFRKIDYVPGLARVIEKIGLIHLENNELQQAMSCFEQAEKFWVNNRFYIGLISLHVDKAKLLTKQRKFIEAKASLDQAFEKLPEIQNPGLWAQAQLQLGQIYRLENNYPKALENYEQALANAEKSDAKPTIEETHRALAELYEKQGEYHKALIHDRIANALRQEIFSEETRQRLKNIQINQEIEAAEREAELQKVRLQETENILLKILPETIVAELMYKGKVKPEYFDSASVLFTDFVGFTKLTEEMRAHKVISELDKCFTAFDKIIQKYQLEKLKTIGDAYMAVGGVPMKREHHAILTVLAGLEMLDYVEKMRQIKKTKKEKFWQVRIGINSGPLVAGVIGKDKFAYDIWGNTVNTANRMESSGQQGKLNVSKQTYELIKDYFQCRYRGKVAAKGKGKIDMYFVDKLKPAYASKASKRKANQKLLKLLKN